MAHPILTLSPELKKISMDRNLSLLSQIIRKNIRTTYFQDSPHLSEFREYCLSVGLIIGPSHRDTIPHHESDTFFENIDKLAEVYHKLMRLSLPEDYQKFSFRFSNSAGCRISDVQDLFSPGLPLFISHTSGTTGAHKRYPKHSTSYRVPSSNLFQAQGKICRIASLRYYDTVDLLDDDGRVAQRIPICPVISGNIRVSSSLDVLDDESRMNSKDGSWTSPYAVSFIPSYTGCIFMHALFAIVDPTLTIIQAMFGSVTYDFIRLLEDHWDAMVEAVKEGKIAELYDFGDYVKYLEPQFPPNPARAAQLQLIVKGRKGWLKEVWPSLTTVNTVVSGTYAPFFLKLKHHFGDTVKIDSVVYGSTEGPVGYSYGADCRNLFKTADEEYTEFLDIERSESHGALSQAWTIEVGRFYEIVLTTQDGLWRYRLGDVVEIVGFDSIAGSPLINYVGRRNVELCIASESLSEKQLRDAIYALQGSLGSVLEFTIEIDKRKEPHAYGYFVELGSELGQDAREAPSQLHALLQAADKGYKQGCVRGEIGQSTIRVVAPKTFRDFRDRRVKASGSAIGQTKIPTALTKREAQEWMANRVLVEV